MKSENAGRFSKKIALKFQKRDPKMHEPDLEKFQFRFR